MTWFDYNISWKLPTGFCLVSLNRPPKFKWVDFPACFYTSPCRSVNWGGFFNQLFWHIHLCASIHWPVVRQKCGNWAATTHFNLKQVGNINGMISRSEAEPVQSFFRKCINKIRSYLLGQIMIIILFYDFKSFWIHFWSCNYVTWV